MRIAALAQFGRELDAIGRGETPLEAPFPALAAAIRTHDLPLAPFHDLLSAFTQDVTTARYADYATLRDYCRRSANPVGRLLLALYRAQAPDNLVASDAICTGLQLTNFWQDVAIDWRKDRVYLPQEDLDRFGVTTAAIAAAKVDVRWQALMAFEVDRTRALLESGRPLVRRLPWRLGLELSAVIAGGLRILERIEAADGDVFARRPVLRARDWCAVAYRALRPAQRTSA
jgi:squalene synthase HpnC